MSSTAIFLSQQSRQYFSSPRGSETSFALQSAQRTCATDLRGIRLIVSRQQDANTPTPQDPNTPTRQDVKACRQRPTPAFPRRAGAYMVSTYSFTIRRALKRGATLTMALRTTDSQRRGTPLSRSWNAGTVSRPGSAEMRA